MSLQLGNIKRRIVPRWRSSQRAANSPEFTALKAPKVATLPIAHVREELDEAQQAFEQAPSVGSAAEAMATMVLLSQGDRAKAPAAFVLANRDSAPFALVDMAQSISDGAPATYAQTPAHPNLAATTRVLLRTAPDNPMLWSDLARHYASLGDKKRAMRCMMTAQQLAPGHRWILRTMARFLIHHGDAGAAHKLLANHPRTGTDPWLIAAELACAQVAGRAPKFWRKATDLLKFDAVAPIHASELATAVAMMELEAGERKRARKLVHKSLAAPTENTLAQVFWAQEHQHLGSDQRIYDLVHSTRDAYEAEFKLTLAQGDLLTALEAAKTWRNDEPFAKRPLNEISYVASLLDAHDLAISTADQALQMDGRVDANLEMNRIFCLLSSGRLLPNRDRVQIARIGQQLRRAIEQEGSQAYHAMANLGLWHFRFGLAEDGRTAYKLAIAAARKVATTEVAALASTFAAREALLVNHAEAAADLKLATDLVAKSNSKVAEFYLRKVDALARAPADAASILAPQTASNFLHKQAPQSSIAVARTPKGYVITLGRR